MTTPADQIAQVLQGWETGWVPRELTWFHGQPVVTLERLEDLRITEPFLPLSRRRSVGRPLLLPLDTVPLEPGEAKPAGFIFHMMRCGSTLVTRALETLPGYLVLSEPEIFDQLLRRAGDDHALCHRRLRALLLLHARALSPPGRPIFVKWNSVLTQFEPLLSACWPDAPRIFIYREPLEVLVSCMEGVPGHLRASRLTSFAPHLRPETLEDLRRMAAPELLARYLGSCLYFAARSARMPVLDYRALPGAIWNGLADHFGLTLDAADRQRMEVATCFYSKADQDGSRFTPDSEAKRARATPHAVALAERFIAPELSSLLSTQPRVVV